MAKYFIDRPILAWVFAIIVMLAGALSISRLPLEQYPQIAPTTVSISATYTGASAKTIEDSVTQVIEQQMKGLDNLTYMTSSSNSAGTATVRLTFDAGTNPDVAQMQVQNKLQQALSQLPTAVQNQGVTVTKSGTDYLMMITMVSEDGSASATDIGDYISSNLVDVMARLDGVGEVQTMGSAYAMRIWLDADKLNKYALMPSDVSSAVQAQNTEVSAGQLGALPAPGTQQLNATISARSKLKTPEQFRAIVLKTGTDGSVVTLGDVARVELGSASYDITTNYNGKPAAGMGIKMATGANALSVAKEVKAKLAELQPYFPNKMKAVIGYDTTPFVRISIEEVVKTLVEAIVLVVLVIYLFLQNLRATVILGVSVPVVLLGTFGVLAAFGYSINTLTMFGMVLAIGLLVDDAIVVVENVERVMHEKGLSPREATRKSMSEITGALVGIALVLSAVFIPMAFFGGSTGVIYRQFSVTIVSAMLLSVLVAMTLTPALCASILKAPLPGHAAHEGNGPLARFFRWFNRAFDRNAERYQSGVGKLLRRSGRGMVIYALLAIGMAGLFARLPTSFLPDEDQGVLMAAIKMPAGATAGRLKQTMTEFEQYLAKQPDVKSYMTITGLGGDQGSGNAFITLKDWSERTGKGHDAASVARTITAGMSKVRDAQIFVMLPPAVRGLGSNAGFDVQLQDVGGLGHAALVKAKQQFLKLAANSKLLAQTRANDLDDTSQFSVTVDDAKAGALHLATTDINDTLSSAIGGSYINDFLNNGRVKKVYMQGDSAFRMQPQDIDKWYVRNSDSEMVSFASFATSGWTFGAPQLDRYNGMSSIEIIGSPAAGVSSGDAMKEVQSIVKQLPAGISYSWSGASYQEQLSGSQAPLLYAISVLFVFLCLAGLYESWSVPFSVILAVPVGVFGALLATTLAGLSNDVYFQVGLLITVGLAAKNAILIVEFAKMLQEQGMDLIAATLAAVRLRLRPILMTSFAFICGVLPMAISSGAGAGGRRAIGVGVLGGMVSATVLGIFFVPLFFVLIRRFFSRGESAPATELVLEKV
ncbi:efflux RND transporter permease subunit [Duganella sp. FT80W]|uniref:Efflux pump membrane transporter n=1 Tax=Duganella guangzhouensis TaxID=2666084 RepID=A0A6I2L2M6_9BURK|nr:efflux RND transporter permease subunit [Duganella guangzhouensis]MRW91477.1 efflux RND transporter permease subunit [Duganella guangzhouensis]